MINSDCNHLFNILKHFQHQTGCPWYMIKVYDIEKNPSKGEKTHIVSCIFKDSTATNFVRDALWNPLNENELLSIGWDTKLNRHIIS